MTPELVYVLGVILVTLLLFATEKIRMDLVALLALLALALPGLLSAQEAVAGFSDQSVIIIAGLFVVGGAMFRTGLADAMGRRLQASAGTSYLRMLVLVMLSTAALSAFLSSTGTVAVMLPIVVSLARRARVSPSLLLMPMAYAALLGGTLTLIATPPNLIVSSELENAGFAPFSFFEFTGPGLLGLLAGIGYMALIGRRLLPERVAAGSGQEQPGTQELWDQYGLSDRLLELEINPDSRLRGRTIGEASVRSRHGLSILAVSTGRTLRPANPATLLQARDVLSVKGSREAVERFAGAEGLRIVREQAPLPPGLLLAEVLVSPGAKLQGQTVAESSFRKRFGAAVVGIRRAGTTLDGRISQAKLQMGDALLLLGPERQLTRLTAETADLVTVTETRELQDSRFRRDRAPWAIVILLLMLAVMAVGLIPNVLAVLLAAAACVLTGCIDPDEAYRSVNWASVIMIASILPVATALQKTGGLDLLSGGISGLLAGLPVQLVLAGMFLLTALAGLLISNTATAVLIAPVAVQVALSLGLDARAMAMVVALACSAAFVTPVSSPVNMLVLSSGGYRFRDFVRVGLPLLLVLMLVTVFAVPLFFPLVPPV